MESITCENCGGTEFTRESGHCVCNDCGTQSQDFQEQYFEQMNDSRIPEDRNEDREVITSHLEQQDRSMTSWECYNIVLKGLVEQLMELGASPRLKVTVFQLWALYLKTAKVAFVSETEEKFPSLPLGFKIKDAYALWGIPNLRKKLFKNNWNYQRPDRKRKISESDTPSISSISTQHSTRRSRSLKQRKVALAELAETSRTSGMTDSSDIETLNSIDKEMKRRSQKVKSIPFKKSTKKALFEISGRLKILKNNRIKETTKNNLKKTIKRHIFDGKRCPKRDGKRTHNMQTNTITLISIIRVALLLLKDEIMLGDILRWICEGRLSVNQPENFVTKFYLFVKKNDLLNVNRNGLQLDIKNLSSNIQLHHLPTPNLFKLLERYCDELSLPTQFFKVALQIMNDRLPQMDSSKFKITFPDYECRTMAYILFTFKLLFSLDDFTEYHLDKFAEAVNERRRLVPREDIPKLFSWTGWVRYIECRKAVLAKYDVSVNHLAYDDRINNEEVFHEYWKKVKPTYDSQRQMNPVFLTTLQNTVKNLSVAHRDRSVTNINFPVSLTPSVTGIKYLLTNHPELVHEKSREILSDDFSSCSATFALNFELCENVAELIELNVESSDDYSNSEIHVYERPENKLLALTKTTLPPITFPVDVKTEDDLALFRNEDNKCNVCEKFEPNITRIEKSSSNSKRSIGNTVYKIYNPAKRYWFFHEFYRRISLEEFHELIAENLSSSFLWLLKECASILRVDSKELYLELIIIEAVLCPREGYDKCVSLQIREEEW